MAGRQITPGEQAQLDQVATRLRVIVDAAVAHAADCTTTPRGVCLGSAVIDALTSLTCSANFSLLQEAVAQLARARLATGDKA